ncbi:MAG: thioredoxin domain-containing protein [Myxococcota bacterium]
MNRLRWAPLLITALVFTTGATCKKTEPSPPSADTATAPAAAGAAEKVELEGIDTASLTPREHQLWSRLVGELLAPCADVAVPVATCVREKRDCDRCRPAAAFLLRAVQAGKTKEEATESCAGRFDDKAVKTIVVGDSPSKGPERPKVTLVEFADFECPACGYANPVVQKMYAQYGKQMQVVFKHFPLDTHPNARLAAQAAWAAQQQGQFWPMHDLLFSNQDRLTEPDLLTYARQLGLEMGRFERDMRSEAAVAAVEKEKTQGMSLGIGGTPALFVNGREVDLSKLTNVVADLEDWIELEIRLEGGEVMAPTEGAKPGDAMPPEAGPSGTPTPEAGPSEEKGS